MHYGDEAWLEKRSSAAAMTGRVSRSARQTRTRSRESGGWGGRGAVGPAAGGPRGAPAIGGAPDGAAAVVEEELMAFQIARPDRLGCRRLGRRRDAHQPVAKEEPRLEMPVAHRRRQQAEIDRAV